MGIGLNSMNTHLPEATVSVLAGNGNSYETIVVSVHQAVIKSLVHYLSHVCIQFISELSELG